MFYLFLRFLLLLATLDLVLDIYLAFFLSGRLVGSSYLALVSCRFLHRAMMSCHAVMKSVIYGSTSRVGADTWL